MIIYNEEKKELIIPTGIGNIDNTIYYDEGFTDGYSSGRTDGYHEGYGNGYGSGYTLGYDEGYNSGYTYGYNSGYTKGVNDAGYYDSGYTNGFSDGYDSGFTDGYDTIFNRLSQLNNFHIVFDKQISGLITFLEDEVYINGRLSPETTIDGYYGGIPSVWPPYLNVSAYTPDNYLESIEINLIYMRGGAPFSAISGPVVINGINEVEIVSQTVEETPNPSSPIGSFYKYTLYFDNARIYDYESYQLGLEACQNNENQ